MKVSTRDAARSGHFVPKSVRPWGALLVIVVGLCALVISMAFSVTQGAVQIPLPVAWDALLHFTHGSIQHLIIQDLRLPRVLASALVGAALAVSGAVMQGITQNPMADSGLMGLNAGAAFALSLCFAFFPGLSYSLIILYSFLGASVSAGLVYGISSLQRGGATPMRLVLAGVAVSTLLAALGHGFAIYCGVAQDILFWTSGGVAGTTWQQLRILFPCIAAALVAAILLSRSISLLSLGEEIAQGLGLRMVIVKLAAATVVLILAGASVSVVGPVGLVGLIIPHITRYLVGVDYSWIIPASAVLGSLLLVLADLGARTLNPLYETPIGAIIALIGVPFFLYLARKQRREM
jgi:iron complex transport system permease protein